MVIDVGIKAHALLSAVHSDTLADTVVKGDLLIGNATPKWARFPAPADGFYGITWASGVPTWEVITGGSTITGPDMSVLFMDGADTPSTFAGFTFEKAASPSPLLTVPGSVSVGDGELGAPSYRFTDVAPTGIWADPTDAAVYGPSVKISTQGSPAPADTATAALGADGVNTNGAHQIYQTHVTDAGETTPFLIATITVTGNKAIDLSALQLGRPNIVLDSNIYMTAAGVTGATNSHLVGSPGDNETDTFTIDIVDASLIGNAAPPTVNTTAMHALTIQGGLFGRLLLDPENENFASGTDALFTNTDGTDNIAMGFDALLFNTSGSSNIAQGRSALNSNTEGSNNIGLGQNVLSDTTEGGNNIAFGSSAGSANVTGNDNIAIGQSSGPTGGTFDNTITIGANATASAGDRAVIGSSITDVFFGSETPSAIAHAAGYELVNGGAFRGSTTTAETWGLDVYDVNGAAYRRFLEATNGDAPSVALTIPTTGTLTGNFSTLQVASDPVVALAATQTLTNKRITKRVVTASDATSITPNSDNADVTTQTNTQAVGTLTINADAGTPTNGQSWLLKIKSTNVQTFSWNAVFIGGTTALPTATTGGSKHDYFAFIWDSVGSKWHYTGSALGFA